MNYPEYHQQDEFKTRLSKLQEIKELGIDPYPAHFERKSRVGDLISYYQNIELQTSEEAETGATDTVKTAGRLILFRPMGKNAFGHLKDQTGTIQFMINREHTLLEGYACHCETDLKPMKFIEKKIDLGDILGVEGNIFRTQKGELTIYVKKLTLLTKSLLPLPDKHSGLVDKELRYRKRWLDLISNEDVTATFILRSKIIQFIRSYFEKSEFLEVETPVLQNIYGGANARPFTTILNDFHQMMYLRISLEIPLKKLIIGGLDRIFEISRVFRNEGCDRTHNPEFTMLEAYAAYWDYNDLMTFTENLFESIAKGLLGKTEVTHPHPKVMGEMVDIDFKAPWIRMTMKESIEKYAKIDVDRYTDEELKKILIEKGHLPKEKVEKLSRGLLIAEIFATFVESFLIQPHHIYDHPIETTPLCKPHRNFKEKQAGIVERFETFILGAEVCNAYSELNDPILQRQLLNDQVTRKQAGDEEAHPFDEEFVEAICQGMPPTGGLGIGIDRLVMLFTRAVSIHDVIYFPFMKRLET